MTVRAVWPRCRPPRRSSARDGASPTSGTKSTCNCANRPRKTERGRCWWPREISSWSHVWGEFYSSYFRCLYLFYWYVIGTIKILAPRCLIVSYFEDYGLGWFYFSCYLGKCKYILVWRLMLKFEKSMKFFMLWRNKNGKRSVLGFVWESSLNLDCDILVHVYLGLGSNPGSTSSVLSRALMLYHCPGWDLYFHQLHHSSSSVGGTLTCVNLFANAMMCVAVVKSCVSVQCL